jgi:hypothetical protein
VADGTDLAVDGRRYSAVAVSHHSLGSLADLAHCVDGLEIGSGKRSIGDQGVRAVRADWHHRQDLYPYGSTLRKSARRQGDDGRFRHQCFIAAIATKGSDRPPTFVFASPHIRVVGGWCAELGNAVDNPRPRYAVPRLDTLFEDLGTKDTEYKATQITLQIPSDVDVEKVALTGKSPLISSLRASLAPVTRPYAVRLEVPREGRRPLRLHLDRHGNYWWYQANNSAFDLAAKTLASLLDDNYLSSTHDVPPRRVASDDSSG